MKVEKTDKPVVQITIPAATSTNPMMIETPGMPVGAPGSAAQPQGVPAPKAGPNLADTVANKPPVALPC